VLQVCLLFGVLVATFFLHSLRFLLRFRLFIVPLCLTLSLTFYCPLSFYFLPLCSVFRYAVEVLWMQCRPVVFAIYEKNVCPKYVVWMQFSPVAFTMYGMKVRFKYVRFWVLLLLRFFCTCCVFASVSVCSLCRCVSVAPVHCPLPLCSLFRRAAVDVLSMQFRPVVFGISVKKVCPNYVPWMQFSPVPFTIRGMKYVCFLVLLLLRLFCTRCVFCSVSVSSFLPCAYSFVLMQLRFCGGISGPLCSPYMECRRALTTLCGCNAGPWRSPYMEGVL
jgi:hypothetical protein